MSETVYYWRVYCTTDHRNEHVWSIDKPTACPLDPLNHTIDPAKTSAIDQRDSSMVQIQEELVATQGIYQFEGDNYIIPAGAPGAVTNIDITWPYDITLMNGGFDAATPQIGDRLSVEVAPNQVVGALTVPAGPGVSILNVTGTVTENVYKGYPITLTDGVQTNACGRCIEVDKINGTITVETEPTDTFSPLSPTYVMMSVEVIKSLYIGSARSYSFAKKKLGGKLIPVGTIVRIKYTNTDGIEKAFIYSFEIMY